MALLLKMGVAGWMEVVKLRDKRMDELFFMKSPVRPLIVIISYAVFVYDIGPRLMKDRKPFNLKVPIMIYNWIQILINSYIFFNGVNIVITEKYNLLCTPIRYDDTEVTKFVTRLFYYYFLTKILDLVDTVFFVLRKKDKQITFLHTYHHMGMVGVTWIACRWWPGGQGSFVGIGNAFIHMIMYFYYFMSSLDAQYAESWKKYITQLQIVQHTYFFFNFFLPLINPNCGYPKIVSWFMVPQTILMISLFTEFYIKTYHKKTKKIE